MTTSRIPTALGLSLFLLFFAGCGRTVLEVGGDADPPDAVPTGCAADVDCDDDNPCNGAESCTAGECTPGTPVDCDDGVECTADTCDATSGECISLPDHDLCERGALCDPVEGCRRRACAGPEDCDDGAFCNGAEFCQRGECQPGSPIECNDGIACTADLCDESTDSCIGQTDDALCNDGNFCNGTETCSPDIGCLPGRPVECDDGDPCTIDSCDSVTGACISTAVDADRDGFTSCLCSPSPCDCDDHDVTVNPGMREQCRDLRDNDCNGLIDCDDRDACGDDPRCGAPPCESHDDCDDGIFCNGTELCGRDGRCSSAPPISCDDSVDCTIDTCSDLLEGCHSTPDDDRCADDERCDPVMGCVGSICTSDDDCDDGVFCNGGETCLDDGTCQRGTSPICNDGVDCTIDVCSEASEGCLSTPDDDRCDRDERCDPVFGCLGEVCGSDVDCDDGTFCNGSERCLDDGTCARGAAPDCEDGIDCTDDVCDSSTDSCAQIAIHERCDDGLFCTGVERCDPDGGCSDGLDPCASTGCAVAVCIEDEDSCEFSPIDADDDGFVDDACDGDDCDDSNPDVNPLAEEICDDLIDNDCNGDEDCDDLACVGTPRCCIPTGREVCDDGVDNDCDGRLDCEDLAECARHSACCVPTGPEICDDEVDNDCDGFTDCSDFFDCNSDPACEDCFPELCFDSEDNDCDDLVDCDDPDCAWFPTCAAPDFETDCANGIDDDLDSLTDCDDDDCDGRPECTLPDTCDDAIEITSEGTYTGSTERMEDDYQPIPDGAGCRGGSGPDVVYFGRVTSRTHITIDSYGSSYDTVLFIRAGDCEAGEQIACNDDADAGLQSEVSFVAEPGVVYWLFVDGWAGDSLGDYEITVTLTPIGPEICDNGVDDDEDSFVDCDDLEDCAGDPACVVAPERGVAGCTDGRDNDGDGLFDCDDTEDCAVFAAIGECCDGVDENSNGAIDEFACACDAPGDCDEGFCYTETVGACGPSCFVIGGDTVCDFLFPGSRCSPFTNTCVF